MAIKWPNDIFASADPHATLSNNSEWRKLAGILCQSNHFQGRFVVTVGFGLNVTNAEPSICVQKLCADANADVTREVLLARVMNELEPLLLEFLHVGFSKQLMSSYEANWMHTGQRVQLENKEQLVVLGLSDSGFLLARDEATGEEHELHPDGNSFDWFQGLVKRKR